MSAQQHNAAIEERAERELALVESRSRQDRSATGSPTSPLAVCDLHDLLQLKLPERDMLLAPWLQSQSLGMIYSWRGVGKTYVSLGIAYALASGGSFLGWQAQLPVPVLYIDGEMPAVVLQERAARFAASNDREAARGMLRFITPDLQPTGRVMPNLADHEGQSVIDSNVGNARVIVVDNLSCLVRGGKENESESWQPVAEWALRQRAAGRSVLFNHHAGKGGAQRGTSKREDLLDTSMLLKRPADYRADEGARFEVRFEKARALLGQDVQPFEAKLETSPDGRQVWTTQTVENAADAQIIELANLGLRDADIAREIGCHRSTVLRALRKAQDEGRYTPKPKAQKGGRHG